MLRLPDLKSCSICAAVGLHSKGNLQHGDSQDVRLAGRQHRILEGPTIEALARARPCSMQELKTLSKVPRFSKNKRNLYGQDIVTALQQVRTGLLKVSWCCHVGSHSHIMA